MQSELQALGWLSCCDPPLQPGCLRSIRVGFTSQASGEISWGRAPQTHLWVQNHRKHFRGMSDPVDCPRSCQEGVEQPLATRWGPGRPPEPCGVMLKVMEASLGMPGKAVSCAVDDGCGTRECGTASLRPTLRDVKLFRKLDTGADCATCGFHQNKLKCS